MERAEASPYSRHMPALDGIRGVAAIGVILSHIFPGTAHNMFESAIRLVLGFGAGGVDLFFVLSGFLITGILYDSLGEERYFRKFYARRILRIFPLYYGVLLVYAIFALIHHQGLHRQMLSLALYLHNTRLLSAPIWQPANSPMASLDHFWSLAVEEQFYLVWPLVVFLVRRRERLLLICAASIVLCPLLRLAAFHAGLPDQLIHASMITRADSLLTGAALSLLLRGTSHDRTLRAAPWLLAIAFPAAWMLVWLPAYPSPGAWDSIVPLGFHYTALAMASAALIACSVGLRSVAFTFQWFPLRKIGKYSYGLYVYHFIALVLLERIIRAWLIQRGFHDKLVLELGVAAFVMGLAGVMSYLSYQLYERQFLRLKRFFDYRPHRDKVPSSDSAGTVV